MTRDRRAVQIPWVLIAAAAAAHAAAMPGGTQSAAAAPQEFRRATNAVALYATVTDAAGRSVSGLTRADFEIQVDGARRDISVFSAAPQPIVAALLLDMNGPPIEVPWLRTAALGFLDAIGPDDRVRLGTFGEEVYLSPRLTGDQIYLRSVLQDELWPSWASPLWNALDEAMGSLPADVPRRDVIVLANGLDLPWRDQMKGRNGRSILRRAEETGTIVHVVTFEDRDVDHTLELLAERTGGRFTKIRDLSYAPDEFASLVAELHAQYLLGFVTPTLDNDSHEVSVRSTRPGLTVRTRTSYRTSR